MELSIGTLIKIIIALVVIAAAFYGLYVVFKKNISDSFGGIGLETTVKSFLTLL